MGISRHIGLIVMFVLCALCGAVCAAEASAKGTGPVACSKGAGNDTCVPAACPPTSNGRPCREPIRFCVKKKRGPNKCPKPDGTPPRRTIQLMPVAQCDTSVSVIGQLIARDNNADGVVEYQYAWSGKGVGEGEMSATWDGERVVPDNPIPLIAAMAEYGMRVTDSKSDANVDRMICATPGPRVKRRGVTVRKSLRVTDAYGVNDDARAVAYWLAEFNEKHDALCDNVDPGDTITHWDGTTIQC